MKILVSYRGIPNAPGWATGDILVKALRDLDQEVIPYGNYFQTNNLLSDISPEIFNPDLLIFLECNDSDPQYMDLLGLKCKKIYWEFDTAMHEGFSKMMWPYFDKVFVANQDYINEKNRYLPYAADTSKFRPKKLKKQGAAIIGSPFQERLEWAKRIGVEVISGVYQDDYVEKLSSLLVSVHNFSSGGTNLIVCRIFETLATGTCLLAEAQSTMGFHFLANRHYMAYSSDEEAKEKLGWLLAHPIEANIIGQNGYLEILSKHTYKDRAIELLNAIS